MESVEIRFSHWHGGFWDPIRDGIGEAHPEITAISESTPWGEYSTKLLTQMVGGVAPDVVMVDSYWQGEWFKVLLPLDDSLDAHGVDNSKWDADPWMQCGNDGKIYSLSQVYCPNWQLVVNRTLAEQEGIDLPDWGDDGPAANYDEWRWDDLVELLKAMTKVNSDGEVEQWGLANSTARFGATSLYFMYSNGAQALDDLWGYNETEALIDSEESVQALQDYIDLTLVDKVAPTPAQRLPHCTALQSAAKPQRSPRVSTMPGAGPAQSRRSSGTAAAPSIPAPTDVRHHRADRRSPAPRYAAREESVAPRTARRNQTTSVLPIRSAPRLPPNPRSS